ncbi:MAG TPA: four helix bundle protein [Bacteroidales bacterium]|jgi:hypothetical protein|nr:four helix bundle protein [Bacteroidales bacterium]HPU46085.1 four helix bundle protein [Bacteroidales bacterium]HRR52722.1 four helix bundle protein [Bacteroidales bacterium]HXK90447.1 four helix bundle protein [Bacteroidales bacterium]
MALVYDLQVYKNSYDFLLEIFIMVHNLNREYKYSLGEKLKNELIDLIVNIYKANITDNKSEHIKDARENIEVIRLLIRILKDLNQISIKRYVSINIEIETISKQLTGWYKSVQK